MIEVFADTSYWYTLLRKRDQLHEQAMAVSAALDPCRIITSHLVLGELLNIAGNKGSALRQKASEFVQHILDDPNTDVVPQTARQFTETFDFYRRRKDKKWSFVDCSSFVTMQRRGIKKSLTADHHFEQAGFERLLGTDRSA